MTAIAGGLGAAFFWAGSALCATAASRRIGAGSTLAWIMTIGLAIVLGPLLVFASLDELSGRIVVLLVLAGLGNVIGLAFEYRAFKIGKVGVVSAIASTEGLAAALIAIAFGHAASAPIFAVLVLITVGVVLTAADPQAAAPGGNGDLRRLLALALPAPLLFGVNLFATGEAGADVSLLWAMLPARLIGVTLVGAPLLARGELSTRRAVMPLVGGAAAAEVAGFAAYLWGSKAELSISAVLASESAAIATAGAYFLFGERLVKRQMIGLGLIAAGVGLLALQGGT